MQIVWAVVGPPPQPTSLRWCLSSTSTTLRSWKWVGCTSASKLPQTQTNPTLLGHTETRGIGLVREVGKYSRFFSFNHQEIQAPVQGRKIESNLYRKQFSQPCEMRWWYPNSQQTQFQLKKKKSVFFFCFCFVSC